MISNKDLNIILSKWEQLDIKTQMKIEILLAEDRFNKIFNWSDFNHKNISKEYHIKEIEEILKKRWLEPIIKMVK